MVISPFKKQDVQKTFSILALIFGIIIVMVSIPFVVKIGGYVIAVSSVGGALVLIGLIYFVEAIS